MSRLKNLEDALGMFAGKQPKILLERNQGKCCASQ
jgi:hypothetical protein